MADQERSEKSISICGVNDHENWQNKDVFKMFQKDNLVPRVSSLLFLYSGIREAIRQSDWLFAILRGNSVLRGVNGHGLSKFDVRPYTLPIPAIICDLFPKFAV